jgi:hypothetical protein
MPELLDEIRTYLLNSAPNKADIAALIGDRIYLEVGDQDAVEPHVMVTELADHPYEYLGGPSHIDVTTVEVACWAPKPSTASNIRKLIRTALHGYRGLLDTIFVSNASIVNAAGRADQPQDASAVFKRDRTIHFSISHQT